MALYHASMMIKLSGFRMTICHKIFFNDISRNMEETIIHQYGMCGYSYLMLQGTTLVSNITQECS